MTTGPSQLTGGQYNSTPLVLTDQQEAALQLDAAGNLKTTATIVAGDIEIGAVELKNSTTDTRANVLAASTAAQATDTPLVVALHPSSPVPAGTNNIGDVDVLTNVLPTPSAAAGVGIANVFSAALETGHVIKASAGNLYGFTGTTTSVAGYFLIFNSTTVPAAGAVTPIEAFFCGAFGSVSREWARPLVCATGISIGFSSAVTPFTKTDSATAMISAQAV